MSGGLRFAYLASMVRFCFFLPLLLTACGHESPRDNPFDPVLTSTPIEPRTVTLVRSDTSRILNFVHRTRLFMWRYDLDGSPLLTEQNLFLDGISDGPSVEQIRVAGLVTLLAGLHNRPGFVEGGLLIRGPWGEGDVWLEGVAISSNGEPAFSDDFQDSYAEDWDVVNVLNAFSHGWLYRHVTEGGEVQGLVTLLRKRLRMTGRTWV